MGAVRSTASGRWWRPPLVAGACGAVFGLVAWMVQAGWGLAVWDDDVLSFVVRHRAGWLTALLRRVTWLGSVGPLIGVLAVASAWFVWRRRERAASAAVALVATYLLASQSKNVLKTVFDRPRPSPALQLTASSGSAFPSGHAADALAVWIMLAVLLAPCVSRRAAVGAWAVAVGVVVAVGASRVYLGVHWPTDVVGGFALSGFWVALVLAVGERLPERFRPRAGPART